MLLSNVAASKRHRISETTARGTTPARCWPFSPRTKRHRAHHHGDPPAHRVRRQACAQKTSPRRRRQALSGGAGLLGAEEAPRASTPRTTRPARPAGRSYFRDGLHLRGGQGGGYVLAGTAPNKGAGPLTGLPPGKRERRPEANSQHPKREGQAPRAPETNRAAQQKAHMRAPLRPRRVNQQLQGGQRKTKKMFRVSPLFRRARLPTRRTRL